MRARRAWVAVLLTAGASVAAWNASAARQDRFPHARHARVFPTCESCHQVGAAGVTFPEPSLCAPCHDGALAPPIDWTGPVARAGNLRFDHVEVGAAKRAALGVDLPCTACHQREGGGPMDVVRAQAATCLGCHAPGAEHQVGAPCATCHVPLTEATAYTVADIAALPLPSDHDEEFVWAHGALARDGVTRCAVCHAQESCTGCHVNADAVPAIQALSSDARVAELAVPGTVEYRAPASHRAGDWWQAHGPVAGVACATCHARESCETCHVEPVPDPVRGLPRGDGAGAAPPRGQGVALVRRPPPSHVPTFRDDHRAAAAATTARCAVCHTEATCASCHVGSDAPAVRDVGARAYHPDNFLPQHSAAAFSQETECATCHNVEAFCRDCHASQGFGTRGRFDLGFHTRKATFVFGHGQAARQGLETCATCHDQRDCLVCHSAQGGRRVNPHGPDFDPERLRDKSPAMCLSCHFRSILDR